VGDGERLRSVTPVRAIFRRTVREPRVKKRMDLEVVYVLEERPDVWDKKEPARGAGGEILARVAAE
jgi:hypothetical protein